MNLRLILFVWALALSLVTSLAQAVTCSVNMPPASNPDSAYTDNGDGTVTHTPTGLSWKRCAEGQAWSSGTCIGSASNHTWAQALTLASTSSFAGKSDWRLPDYKEFISLVEECRAHPAINDAIFPNTPSSDFWSGSPHAGGSNSAWGVIFNGGNAYDYGSRSYSLAVRLVRGGQSFGSSDTTAPSVPSGLAASVVGSSQINLSWNAATDNVGVTAYKVYRNSVLIATLGNVTSYSNTGLSASTGYSYTVAACDAAGNCSSQSVAASATTVGVAPTFTPPIHVSTITYGFDQPGPFYNLDTYVTINNEPTTSISSFGFYSMYYFQFQNGVGGYMGLQKDDGQGKKAIFSIWDGANVVSASPVASNCVRFGHEGSGTMCLQPFQWVVGHEYRIRIWSLGVVGNEETWAAFVQDTVTGVETFIGSIKLSSNAGFNGYGRLTNSSFGVEEYYGGGSYTCNTLPYFSFTRRGPYADNNAYSASSANIVFPAYGNAFPYFPCTNSNVTTTGRPYITQEAGGSIVRTASPTNAWSISAPVLTATAASSSQINLTWTGSSAINAYKVYRAGALVATLGNVTSYSDTGLNASTSYSYTVQACDAAGNCSAQSAAASATTAAALTPPVCALSVIPSVLTVGDSSTLTATCTPAATSYTWTGGTCAGTTAATCTVTPTSTTTYSVTGTNAGGTGAAVSASVTVNACVYTLGASNASVSASVSTGSISVASSCAWTATSNASWISITSGASGSGNGGVDYTVAANTSTSSRTGTLTIAGQTFTVTQAGVYTLSVAQSGTGSGAVSSSPTGISCSGGSTCSAFFSSGTSVTLTATPATGSTFTGWSGACTGTGTCTVSMSAARSVTASFASAVISRYTDNGDGTVTDPNTGLTWMRCAMGQTWTGSTCSGTASTYTFDQANALTGAIMFAGQSDWRVPNIRELQTIVDRSVYNPAIDGVAFPNTPTGSNFWSGSPLASSSDTAWNVDFANGGAGYNDRNSSLAVRLVRGGQSLGSLLNLARPTSDYVDNGNGTATHTPTNLTWKRCPELQTWTGSTCSGTATTFTFDQATALADTTTFAGQSDWRLPTEDELLSLVDYSTYGQAINSSIFPATPGTSFWSGSPYANYSSYAWFVYFLYGVASSNGQSDGFAVRLVRGGQPSGTFVLTVSKSGTGAGTVTGSSAGINCGSTCSASLASGTSVTLTATPASGSTFTGWSGSCSGTGSCTVSMNAVKSVIATFTLNVTAPICTLSANPSSLTIGGSSTLTATCTPAATSYIWTGGTCAGTTAATCTVTPTATTTYGVAGTNAGGTGAAASTTVTVTSSSTLQPNADGTVFDPKTGLTWMRCSMGQTWNGSTCLGTEATYTFDQASVLTDTTTFANQSDWRIPNIRELQTIVDRSVYNPAIDSVAFPNTLGSGFWSGSPGAGSSNLAWSVFFGYGGVGYNYRSDSLAVRLVRGGQSLAPLFGITRPTSDYVDNGNGTVTHTPTNLTWKRCPELQTWTGSTCSGTAKKFTFDQATALTGTTTFAGQSDWRLPTEDELLSLVDYSTYGPAINSSIFPATLGSYFWSGSPYYYSNYAWYVHFNGGVADGYNRSNDSAVRLVRGGQSFGSFVLAVSKSGTGTGTVTGSAVGINCGSTCSASLASGASVTLTATPASGSAFSGWSGSCSGTGSCTVGMNAVKSVTATFTLSVTAPVCTLSANPSAFTVGGGSILTASCTPAATSYTWTGGTCAGTTAATCTVTPTSTTTYSVTGTNAGGMGTAANATVTVNACAYTLGTSSALVSASASTGSISVASSCAWTVTSNASWITIISSASGSGNGSVGYTVEANTSGSSRTGTLTIAGQTFTVTQAAAAPICTLSANPSAFTVGGSSILTASCTPAATSYTWTGGTCAGTTAATCTVTPTATTTYTVTGTNAGGTGAAVSAMVTVNACTYALGSSSASVAASASTGSISVTSSCAWTATSNASWITITSGVSGSGNGTVAYAVATNTSTSARSGTLSIAGQTFTVAQAGATVAAPVCTLSASASSITVGGSSTLTASCTPAATSYTWIGGTCVGTMAATCTVTPTSTTTYSVAGTNAGGMGAAASVTVSTISTYTLFVTKSGAGSGAVTSSPTGISCGNTCSAALASGTSVTLTATPASGSTFTGWSGACNGTGTCTVNMTATQNVTATFTNVCTYILNTDSVAVPATAGTGSISVTSPCAWTATSNASWITITSGASGSGNDTVAYAVAANTGTTGRTGTLTIAGQTFTVTQTAGSTVTAPICTLSANPSSITSGGSATLTATCSPVATSYIWTGGTCAGTSDASCTVSPTATTTYSVQGSNAGGANQAASATVTVTANTASYTVPGTLGNDVFVLTAGNSYYGGAGNDTYIISPSTLRDGVTAKVVDSEGDNLIQLVDGLTLTASTFYTDAAQLTLSNGANVQILGASKFKFQVGANALAGDTAAVLTYSQFVSSLGASLSGTLPASGTAGYVVPTGFTQASVPVPSVAGSSYTVPGTIGDDVLAPSGGNNYLGGGGNDTYIISPYTLSGAVTAKIIDSEGANVIQLVKGLTIASSTFYNNAVQLTLSNGASVQILGASGFSYQLGANAPAGVVATSLSYAQFAAALGASVPTGTSAQSGSSNFVVPGSGQ